MRDQQEHASGAPSRGGVLLLGETRAEPSMYEDETRYEGSHGTLAWMEHEWMQTLEDDAKARFRMKRYMDDVITVTAKDDSAWDVDRFRSPQPILYASIKMTPQNHSSKTELHRSYQCDRVSYYH